MADVDGAEAGGRVERGLEGEDAEEQVEGAGDAFDAAAAPDPDLGGNVVGGANAQGLDALGQGDIKGVVVEGDEQVGAPFGGQGDHIGQDAFVEANLGEDLDDAHGGEGIGVIKELGTLGAERVAPHAADVEFAAGEALAQGADEGAAVHVAGDFPGGNHDFEGRGAHSARRVTIRSGALTPPWVT